MKRGINVNRLGGFLYLFIRLTAFWGEFRIGSLGIPKDAPNALRIVVEHSGAFRQGAVVTLVMHVSVVALAVPLPLGWWGIVAGATITLEVMRNGQTVQTTLILGERS